MKDVVVKNLGSGICYGKISVNDKEYKVNSEFAIIAKIYNEMYSTDYTFHDIVMRYLYHLKKLSDLEVNNEQL